MLYFLNPQHDKEWEIVILCNWMKYCKKKKKKKSEAKLQWDNSYLRSNFSHRKRRYWDKVKFFDFFYQKFKFRRLRSQKNMFLALRHNKRKFVKRISQKLESISEYSNLVFRFDAIFASNTNILKRRFSLNWGYFSHFILLHISSQSLLLLLNLVFYLLT